MKSLARYGIDAPSPLVQSKFEVIIIFKAKAYDALHPQTSKAPGEAVTGASPPTSRGGKAGQAYESRRETSGEKHGREVSEAPALSLS